MARRRESEDVGAVLLALRRERGLDLGQVEARSGLPRQRILDLETGTPLRDLEDAFRLLGVYGIPPAAWAMEAEAWTSDPPQGQDGWQGHHAMRLLARYLEDPRRPRAEKERLLQTVSQVVLGHEVLERAG